MGTHSMKNSDLMSAINLNIVRNFVRETEDLLADGVSIDSDTMGEYEAAATLLEASEKCYGVWAGYNAHDDLVAALRNTERWLRGLTADGELFAELMTVADNIRAALAKVSP
jgi:hypothetical protein